MCLALQSSLRRRRWRKLGSAALKLKVALKCRISTAQKNRYQYRVARMKKIEIIKYSDLKDRKPRYALVGDVDLVVVAC